MKKTILAVVLLVACSSVFGGQVGLPVEQIALPAVQQGNYLVCVWDDAAGQWLKAHENYDYSGSYRIQLPAWGKWYWIGLWDNAKGQYVYGKWVGHFITN